MYTILQYSYDQAIRLKVKIHPSEIRNYKIDVFDIKDNYITSVGNKNYSDYPHYIKSDGITYADKRRNLYKIRHKKDRLKIGSRGYYADQILW